MDTQPPEDRDVEYSSSCIYRWVKHHPLGNEMHRRITMIDREVVGQLTAVPEYYYWIYGQRC